MCVFRNREMNKMLQCHYVVRTRSGQFEETPILGDKTGLRPNVVQTRLTDIRLDPVQCMFRVQKLYIRFVLTADDNRLCF